MRPILFDLFGLPIRAYGTTMALAFLLAILLASREARKKGFPPEIIVDIALALCLGGLVGARLLYVLLDLGYYRRHVLEIFNLSAGGLSFYGGFASGFAAAWWYGRRKKLPNWQLADLCVPYAALGYAIVRIGCFLNGCCYGVPTRLPWALVCREGDPFTLRHPTQIYASLGSLLLFLVLYKLRDHRRFQGFLFFLYMGLYAVMRGIIEAFRDSQILFAGVRTTQVASLAVAILAFGVIWHGERRRLSAARPGVDSGEEVGSGA